MKDAELMFGIFHKFYVMSMIKNTFTIGLLVLFALHTFSCKDASKEVVPPPPPPNPDPPLDIVYYVSKADESAKFSLQDGVLTASSEQSLPTISIDPGIKYQTMDGFGFSLTGGSALHLSNMSSSQRNVLLNELFGIEGEAIGISYLRVSLGASDLDESVFSYNDLSSGETDIEMERFSLAPDKRYLIPVLKEILAINNDIKILASPWSAPAWMKTNKNAKGGSLKPEYYDAYAKYFVKYILGMANEGITIDAITVQNEPLHDGNNPSMYMVAAEQATFIKQSLGPAFEAAGIKTKIIIYDHNADRTDYPIEVLNDSEARKYIDGSAFHLYGGSINDLSKVRVAHGDKNLYFTEQWIGAPGDFANDISWHTENLIIGATRNWCKTVLEWNLASNPQLEPHTDGGCNQCLGALTINGNSVIRNPAYYIIAHASKFVRPNSKRIESNNLGDLPNVAFETPDGKIVTIVLNKSGQSQSFNIKLDEQIVKTSLTSGAVGTYVWNK